MLEFVLVYNLHPIVLFQYETALIAAQAIQGECNRLILRICRQTTKRKQERAVIAIPDEGCSWRGRLSPCSSTSLNTLGNTGRPRRASIVNLYAIELILCTAKTRIGWCDTCIGRFLSIFLRHRFEITTVG